MKVGVASSVGARVFVGLAGGTGVHVGGKVGVNAAAVSRSAMMRVPSMVGVNVGDGVRVIVGVNVAEGDGTGVLVGAGVGVAEGGGGIGVGDGMGVSVGRSRREVWASCSA
jgi:hypothetical protein